ncbi:MAG TPA: PEGA domain-containing protein [Candidatus Aminicenantes bacterium]|nr:PEGA domain-containing protein [Candidatus Aminicenantes bacterium]
MARCPVKAALPALALMLAAGLGPACVTILGRTSQGVTVTASSAGAAVFVDGKFAGVTPLALIVAKRAPGVIRIEKDGYRPVEIRLKKRKAWAPVILPNLLWAPPIAFLGFDPDIQTSRDRFRAVAFPVLGAVASVGAMVLDGLSVKSTVIAPGHLDVELEPDAGTAVGPRVMIMDAGSFRGLRWISVRTGGPTK